MRAIAELTAQTHSHFDIGMPMRKKIGQREWEVFRERQSLVRMQPFAWEKKREIPNVLVSRGL